MDLDIDTGSGLDAMLNPVNDHPAIAHLDARSLIGLAVNDCHAISDVQFHARTPAPARRPTLADGGLRLVGPAAVLNHIVQAIKDAFFNAFRLADIDAAAIAEALAAEFGAEMVGVLNRLIR